MPQAPKEIVLHNWWQRRLWHVPLRTVGGQVVEVVFPGQPSTGGGPDFRGAHIRIDGLLWIGDVEIDVFARDWIAHKHDANAAFQTVILEVVWEAQGLSSVCDVGGRSIPILSLAPFLSETLQGQGVFEAAPFPCAPIAREAPKSQWEALYDRLGESRLKARHGVYRSEDDLYLAFWEALLYGFGLPALGEPFRKLARAVPYLLLSRYQDDLLALEAILLGMAGLIPEGAVPALPYEQDLLQRWGYLAKKHQLSPLSLGGVRYRPINAPAIRLSILANLLAAYPNLAALLAHPPQALPLPSSYWQIHYAWQKKLPHPLRRSPPLLLQNLRINVLYPFAIYYYRLLGRLEQALAVVERFRALPPENHRYARFYQRWAYSAQNAWQTQGQIALWRDYCRPKRCLSCVIGLFLRGNG